MVDGKHLTMNVRLLPPRHRDRPIPGATNPLRYAHDAALVYIERDYCHILCGTAVDHGCTEPRSRYDSGAASNIVIIYVHSADREHIHTLSWCVTIGSHLARSPTATYYIALLSKV
jgi:hypothetical protein